MANGAALALLSMLDPEAFDVAFTTVPTASNDSDEGTPRYAANAVGWPAALLTIDGARGDGTASGARVAAGGGLGWGSLSALQWRSESEPVRSGQGVA